MKPIKITTTQLPTILDIRWLPNNVCNYACRYCHPHSHDGDYGSPKDLELIIKNFNHLAREYREKLGKTVIHLKLAGGEPTLWKDLALFVEGVKKENDIYFTIISNGSRTIRWWKEYGHLIDNAHLTLHLEQGDVDHMIEVADILHSLGKKTTVKVLMDPYQWDKGIEAVEYMKENSKEPWFIIVGEVQEPDNTLAGSIRVVTQEDKKYTPDQIAYMRDSRKRMPPTDWFEKNNFLFETGAIRINESIAHFPDGTVTEASPNYYLNNTWNSFKGWSCDVGLESFSIHWDGNLKGSCGQKLFGLDYFYNILDQEFCEKFKVENTPAICEYYNCGCQPENHISKFKQS
jgi:organic radical activating enzyme